MMEIEYVNRSSIVSAHAACSPLEASLLRYRQVSESVGVKAVPRQFKIEVLEWIER